MNRNEQKFYHDVNRIADSLESIAKSLQKPNLPEMPDSFFKTDGQATYDASRNYSESTLKDLIEDGEEETNPFDDIIDEVTERTGRLQKINESLDSFFSIRKPLYSRSMNLTKLQKKSWRDDGSPRWSYGEMTQYMLHFVKENPGCTYTDMNKFYLCCIGGLTSYDSVRDRGGSFPHHYQSLVSMKKRRFAEDVENHFELQNVMEQWIEKEDDGTYKYYERKRTLPHQSYTSNPFADPKKKVKKAFVLDFVESCGDEGATYTDIIRYMYEKETGLTYTTENRGWYSSYMSDGGMWNQSRKGGWINPTKSHPNKWIENRGGRYFLNTHPIKDC